MWLRMKNVRVGVSYGVATLSSGVAQSHGRAFTTCTVPLAAAPANPAENDRRERSDIEFSYAATFTGSERPPRAAATAASEARTLRIDTSTHIVASNPKSAIPTAAKSGALVTA